MKEYILGTNYIPVLLWEFSSIQKWITLFLCLLSAYIYCFHIKLNTFTNMVICELGYYPFFSCPEQSLPCSWGWENE